MSEGWRQDSIQSFLAGGREGEKTQDSMRRRMLSHRSNMKPGNELTSLVRMIPGGVKSREQKNPQQKHIVLTNSSIFT
jgi:hypothetical protein